MTTLRALLEKKWNRLIVPHKSLVIGMGLSSLSLFKLIEVVDQFTHLLTGICKIKYITR